MSRLLIFLSFLILASVALSFTVFQNVAPKNEKFDFEKTKDAYEKEQQEIYLARNPPKPEQTADEQEVQPEEVIEVALDTPRLERGHEVYTRLGQCVTCHGNRGQGKTSQQAPKVAGQHEWYLVKQLMDMKKGIRVNARMNPYLRKLTEQDLKDVSHYLAQFPTWN